MLITQSTFRHELMLWWTLYLFLDQSQEFFSLSAYRLFISKTNRFSNKDRVNLLCIFIVENHILIFLTEAEAKTPNARLSLQRSSCCSRTLALACSCASLAVGMVISCSALSSSPPLTSLILVSSSSSFSSSSYIFINVNNRNLSSLTSSSKHNNTIQLMAYDHTLISSSCIARYSNFLILSETGSSDGREVIPTVSTTSSGREERVARTASSPLTLPETVNALNIYCDQTFIHNKTNGRTKNEKRSCGTYLDRISNDEGTE